MKLSKKIGVAVFTTFVVIGGLNLAKNSKFGERIGISWSLEFVSSAMAKVGRPLSPVSVAGVARRN
jgi:hypothetical protein